MKALVSHMWSRVSLESLVHMGLIAAAIALAIFVVRLPGPIDRSGQHVGGDFLNFYTAGYIVLTGRGAALYDLATQVAAQRELVAPADWQGIAPFLNPPILALAWAPIAALPFKPAYVVSTAALSGALLCGLRVLRPHVPALHSRWSIVVGLAFLFLPLLRTVTGGQNTAITFALLAAGYASLRSARDVWAGVWLGLLLYKPQYAVLPALLLLVCRRRSALVAFAGTAAAQYVVGALICGADWPIQMSTLIHRFMPRIFEVDGHQLISWLNFAEYAMPGALARPLGAALAAATLGALLLTWHRPLGERGSQGLFPALDTGSPRFPFSFGSMVAASLSCSPHAQWYDAGLLLLPVLLGVDAALARRRSLDRPTRWGVAAGFLLVFPLYQVAPRIGWQPVAFVPPLVFAWLRHIERSE